MKEIDDFFKAQYKVLKVIRSSMNYSSPDKEAFTAEALDIPKPLYYNIIENLIDEEYIRNAKFKRFFGDSIVCDISDAKITSKGMEYLENNSTMKKISNILKGIKDVKGIII